MTRVIQVVQGSLDLQEWMEHKDLKETKVTLQSTVVPQGQRVSQEPLDVQDIPENLEIGAYLEFKGLEDHLECQGHLVS